MKLVYVAAVSLLALTACDKFQSGTGGATGPTQEVKIVTVPSDANCAIDVNNRTVDRVKGTPLTARVPVSDNTVIRCLKSGYKEGKATVKRGDSSVAITLPKKR